MTTQKEADPGQPSYVFDPVWELETERLIANEAIWDPGTFANFEQLGVAPGWSCLEVGAGAGSAAKWLATRACGGDSRSAGRGRVVATDVEVARLGPLKEHGVEAWQHNISTDDLPEQEFDLVHSRMLVQHLPDKPAAIGRMIRALRPGGVLVLEDTDSLPLFRSATGENFLQDIRVAGYGLMRQAGHEPRGGHFDLAIMLGLPLRDVFAQGRAVMVQGGSTQARHYMLWLEFMRPKIIAAGLLDDARIDTALTEMADPANRWLSQVMISVFGTRP